MHIPPSILRLFWTVVQDIPSHDLLTLSDTGLILRVLQAVSSRMILSGEEVHLMYAYTGSKLSLIQDLALCCQREGLQPASN